MHWMMHYVMHDIIKSKTPCGELALHCIMQSIALTANKCIAFHWDCKMQTKVHCGQKYYLGNLTVGGDKIRLGCSSHLWHCTAIQIQILSQKSKSRFWETLTIKPDCNTLRPDQTRTSRDVCMVDTGCACLFAAWVVLNCIDDVVVIQNYCCGAVALC